MKKLGRYHLFFLKKIMIKLLPFNAKILGFSNEVKSIRMLENEMASKK